MLVFNNLLKMRKLSRLGRHLPEIHYRRLWIFKTHGILNVSHGVSAFTKKGFDAAASFFLLD